MFVQPLESLDYLFLIAIVISTALYVVALEALDYKNKREPDLTWLEVVIGNAIILLWLEGWRRAGGLAASGHRGHSEAQWAAFIVGGAPVVLWQLAGICRRHRAAWSYRLRAAARRGTRRGARRG